MPLNAGASQKPCAGDIQRIRVREFFKRLGSALRLCSRFAEIEREETECICTDQARLGREIRIPMRALEIPDGARQIFQAMRLVRAPAIGRTRSRGPCLESRELRGNRGSRRASFEYWRTRRSTLPGRELLAGPVSVSTAREPAGTASTAISMPAPSR